MMQEAIQAAERYIVSTCFLRPELTDEIASDYTDFQDPERSLIYRTIRYLYENGKPVTSATLLTHLGHRVSADTLDEATSPLLSMPSAIQEHDRIVRSSGRKRKLTEAYMRIGSIIGDTDEVTDSTMAAIQQEIAALEGADIRDTGLIKLSELVPDHVQRIEERYANNNTLRGVTTGFADLDAVTGGWQLQDLAIVAARPSMGKSAFMLQSALKASKADAAAIFSLEMADSALLDRAIATLGPVRMYALNSGLIREDEWPHISFAVSGMHDLELYLDDTPAVTVSYMRSRLRRLKRKIPEGRRLVVFIDYLQIIQGESARGRSREQEVGDISRSLKRMAKELDCAVVALAQLSRSVENRQDKHPMMSDIRESGSIEQDADLVSFLYRDEYYNSESQKKNVLEVIISKQRNGKTGMVELTFLKEFQHIASLERRRAE